MDYEEHTKRSRQAYMKFLARIEAMEKEDCDEFFRIIIESAIDITMKQKERDERDQDPVVQAALSIVNKE